MGAQPPRDACPGDILLAVHNFDARGEDELSLRRGDKIELLELDDGFGDGWFLGKHVTGDASGLFPGVYTAHPQRINVQQTEGPSESNAASQSEPSVSTPDETDKRLDSAPNEDVTPQASRQVSTSDAKLPPDSVSEPNSNQPDRPRPVNPSSVAPMSRGIQRTISETIGSNLNGEDSPVLNETLSVIDEHITDFNTPRHSVVAHEQRSSNDSGSEYSSHISHRLSYIPGAETDDEEEDIPSEAEVRGWDAKKTADHLRALGVESKHCDIFEQEEISGDVLLEMDQEFLYMKDFDFGVMGRRLKTWHKVKGFQEEIRGPRSTRESVSPSVSSQPRRIASDEFDRSQSRTGVSFLPRIPSVNEGQKGRRSRRDTTTTVDSTSSTQSPSAIVQMGKSTSSRPSADSIRQGNYRKRHSSVDTTYRSQRQDAKAIPPAANKSSTLPRDKSSSFDRGWTMASGAANLQRRPDTALGTSDDPNRSFPWSTDGVDGPPTSVADDSIDADKGYFSGGEVENRRSRNMLRKRDSAARSFSHSRHSSATGDPSAMSKLRTRFGLADSLGDIAPQPNRRSDNRTRSRTTGPMEMADDDSHSPTVTNLEDNPKSTNKPPPSRRQNSKQNGDSSNKNSPVSNFKNVAPIVRRAMGLRAISDAVTGHDKAMVSSSTSASPAKDSPASPVRTDSSTPSGASKSFELDSTDSSLKGPEGHMHIMHKGKVPSNRSRSKKETSAYTRGLERKPPEEQIAGCDYYGWMKKKSSHLMTTWKPRLFVLRGRRLSYYYSEDDTEERGLIDISSHRVFRADHDTITSLHATLTGAKGFPTSPHHIGATDFSPADAGSPAGNRSRANSHSADGTFIFKLVPPKAGSPRAVQFTKPAIHFFQVDNIQQGRLWMAALMKATIERDLNLPVKSSNKQKTVSLKQAVAMNQMPPSFKGTGTKESEQDGKPDADQSEADTRDSNTDESAGGDSVRNILRLSKLDEFDAGSLALFSETPSDNNARPSD